jgi:hypothetical protein
MYTGSRKTAQAQGELIFLMLSELCWWKGSDIRMAPVLLRSDGWRARVAQTSTPQQVRLRPSRLQQSTPFYDASAQVLHPQIKCSQTIHAVRRRRLKRVVLLWSYRTVAVGVLPLQVTPIPSVIIVFPDHIGCSPWML